MSTNLKIDPEFQNLIPLLSDDELQGLEQNILAHGRCRDAIVVWRGIIVDGHNRYAICQKHDIPYETVNIYFASRKEAQLWIIQNQLGRRNLTDALKIDLANRKAMIQKPRNGKRMAIAKDAGVSEQTVQKYMTIKKLGDPDLLAKVNSGILKISTAHAMIKEAVEVTVKTVSPLCIDGCNFEVSEESRIIAINRNIDKIEKLYAFLMDVPVDEQSDIDLICKRFNRHNGILKGMTA